ncbi:MAG: hypothetical protein KGR98_11265 [Verrucomicrobia bacterium]|nr:hypothetical protein [Verrucomicrobiota bacterium]MDE3099077.1 hypothetical protein [Verrucomicrobiota bacterium]
MTNEWNIQSRAAACGSCARPFADRQPLHTLLFDEPPFLRRLDVCQECWQNQFSQGARDRKGFISHWQGLFEAPTPVAEPIQRDTAETLLRKLVALNDPRHAPAGYILAVMLERKRLLKVKEQTAHEGRRIIIYEQPGTGDVFTIPDPAPRLDQLEQIQQEVAHLLEHGLEPRPENQTATVSET